jgi:multidrug efflux system outer membrane protein
VKQALILISAALTLVSCTLGPNYRRPEVEVPPAFRGLGPEIPAGPGSIGDLGWWVLFQDDALQSLIRTALAANYDVLVAAQRILDARAQVTIARSFQFPTASASGSAPYTRIEGSLSPLQARETFSPLGSLDFAYEADLWGRYRRGTEAARADLLASEDARRFVMNTLVSDVATLYFQLRSLDLQLEISRRTLASRNDSLRLVTMRQVGGVAALIDVRQTEILVATAAETIPDTERQIEQTENAISVLLGANPEPVARGRPLGDQLALPPLPSGAPSDLLERRPDVRQAEQELAAATARIGVAKADFFPRVFLFGSAGAGGVTVNGSWFGPQGVFAFLPSFTLPIFNSGRVAAGVESAEARAEAARLHYEQTVQGAIRDVSDALVEYRKRREFRAQQEALVVAARDTTRLANIRYRGGVSSYLEVLDSESRLFDAELGLSKAQRDELLGMVLLYKGLGGGWQE